MARTVSIKEFLDLGKNLPILDVRTPAEFSQGHIPGASNLPLFSNEERVEIGTIYVRQGRENAMKRGLEIVGPKMRGLVEAGEKAAKNGSVLLHCWRGGMRSGAVSWLLSFYGLTVITLEKGYKAFRTHVLADIFQRKRRYLILGGRTGTGKTATLNELTHRGERVVDLEEIAHHRGSSFGMIGMPSPPTQEQFENNLALQLDMFDYPSGRNSAFCEEPIWLESESRKIGQKVLPLEVFRAIQSSPAVILDADRSSRIRYLTEMYGSYPGKELAGAIQRLSKRLGGEATKRALEAIENDNPAAACEIVLGYYDSTYDYSLSFREEQKTFHLETDPCHPETIAENILRLKARGEEKIWN